MSADHFIEAVAFSHAPSIDGMEGIGIRLTDDGRVSVRIAAQSDGVEAWVSMTVDELDAHIRALCAARVLVSVPQHRMALS